MKPRAVFAAFAMCLIAAGSYLAREVKKADVKSDIPDAVTADGKHYTVEFENEYLWVLRIHYGPNEQGET